ncbi:MAG: hypothetical protein K8J31_10060 [Anaerolineae bacterium]|nr:hypothetical protein [Anaerolineae bacterium]
MMNDFDQLQAQDTVYALAAGPGGIVFAGRASGLYRSSDGGASWQDAYQSLKPEQALVTTAVVIAADGSVFAGVNGGVLRSSDGGFAWFAASLGSPPPLVTALAISPHFEVDGTMLAGTAEDGVFFSTDRGQHWISSNFRLIDLNVYSLALSPDFARDQTALVGTETGLFRSTNGGRAWRSIPFPDEAGPVLSLAISPNFARDGRVFAGTESAGLFTSTDRGDTWAQIAADNLTRAVNQMAFAGERLWLLLDDDLLRSDDLGASWQSATPPAADGPMWMALTVLPGERGHVLVGSGSGDILRAG